LTLHCHRRAHRAVWQRHDRCVRDLSQAKSKLWHCRGDSSQTLRSFICEQTMGLRLRYMPQRGSNEPNKSRNSAGRTSLKVLSSQRFPTGPCCWGMRMANQCSLSGTAKSCSQLVPSAHTTVPRSTRGSSWTIRFAVRCPWHHACFSLRTGEAVRAPALDPVSRWRIEEMRDPARRFTSAGQQARTVYIREKLDTEDQQPRVIPVGIPKTSLSSVVARPAMPPRKRCVTRATPAASPC
jgi:nitrite reductase/ring-hydroxylating ferredoxin subunit